MDIEILVNNNKCEIVSAPGLIYSDLYEQFGVRHPGAFFSEAYKKRVWDGKVRYVNARGQFATGFLRTVVDFLEENYHYDILFHDEREDILKPAKIPTQVGPHTLRPYQFEAVRSIANNKIGQLEYPRGMVKAATNAGKNLIAAALYHTFNAPTLYLINRKEFFDTALEELPQYIEDLGVVHAKKTEWANFTIAMVPTLNARFKTIKNNLASYQVVIADECDLSDNKSWKRIIQALFNAQVRCGMSGTIEQVVLKKYLIKHYNIRNYFGSIEYEISNRELIDLGHSSEVGIHIYPGAETKAPEGTSQKEEYDMLITYNLKRNLRLLKRVIENVRANRLPIMVVVKYHAHLDIVHNLITRYFPNYEVRKAHHKTKNRQEIISGFSRGEVDILVATQIVNRAKNFPMMKVMINAGSGLSPEETIQRLGRATRTHSTKTSTRLEDFKDAGKYLSRHSRRRIVYYKNEKLSVTIHK